MWKRIPAALSAIALAALLTPGASAQQGRYPDGDLRTFAVLPDMSGFDLFGERIQLGHPEGMTADAIGNIYAATFEVNNPNFIYVYDPSGASIATITIPNDNLPLGRAPLGMVTDRTYLYVIDVLNGDLLRYDLPVSNSSRPTAVYDVCGGFVVAFGLGVPGREFCALNANDIGPDGRVYMSDNGAGPSFVGTNQFRNGRIFVTDPRTGASSVWFDADARGELDVAYGAFPEFGANGVAFSNDGTEFYVANMSTDVIYRMPVSNCRNGCQATRLSVFARSDGINGPDNMDFDEFGVLWVASGQNDRVVGINRSGRVIARIGAFEGFTRSGAINGLLQPSGLIVSRGRVYATNEASRGLRPTPDFIPEEEWDELRLFTLVEIRPWLLGPRD